MTPDKTLTETKLKKMSEAVLEDGVQTFLHASFHR